jgi:hypothetical protein
MYVPTTSLSRSFVQYQDVTSDSCNGRSLTLVFSQYILEFFEILHHNCDL